jgi:polyisoprenoid-binding protein YceI
MKSRVSTERRPVVRGIAALLSFLIAIAWSGVVSAEGTSGEIRFRANNWIATANGIFHRWNFKEILDAEGGIGVESATVEIDLASVDTGSDRRDKHLRTDDFFDVERFPTATARIYQIEKGKSGAGLYTSKLDLDLHGFQKTYALVFEVVEGENLEVRGNIEINRMDFEIGTPKSFNPMSITNEVLISFSAKKPSASGGADN